MAVVGRDGKAATGDPATTNQQLQAMRQELDEFKVLQIELSTI